MAVEQQSVMFRFGDFELSERDMRLIHAGEAVALEPKTFRVLLYFLHNPGRLITKDELLNAVWGDTSVEENSLARAISLLRRVLGDDVRNPRYIETAAAFGYRFVSKVERIGGEPAPQPPEPIQPNRNRRKWLLPAFAAGIGTAAVAVTIWYLSRPVPLPRFTAYTQITHDGRSKQLVSTDGSRLYFTQNSPNFLAEVGVNGGEVARLPVAIPGADIQLMDISPDGSNALVGSYEEGHGTTSQWAAPILGGAARRLDDGGGGTFSPDGESVIYSNLVGDIFTVRTDGSGRRKLASVGGIAYGFRWPPDGKRIRFSKDNDGIWEMSADGSGAHRLLPGWKDGVPCCGNWTPDGGLFVFVAAEQLWVLDERRSFFRRPSSVLIQLTSGPIQWDAPVPSKDGKTIFACGANVRGELSRIDLKTGSPQPFLGGISAEFVSFSPDGKSVAYVPFPEGVLWRANRDGSNRVQLTRRPGYAANPRWSPDSKEIVYTAASPDGRDSIHRISAVDGKRLWLMNEESREMHDANWSPDGKRVLFALSPGRGYRIEKGDLRIVDLETRQVTVVPGSEGVWSPRWSADGQYIAGFFGAPVRPGIPLFDFSTRQWRTLLVNGDAEFLSFSHDSRFIYFLRYGSEQGVFRIPVAGGKEERVVNMNDWHITGILGYSMSLDPTDAPLVLRDMSSDDIYALTLEH